MLDRLIESRRREDGFSLIELLVVIVILGILASIVVFAVGGITDKGQDSACSADRKTIQTAEEAYFAKQATGSYATLDVLVTQKLLSADVTGTGTAASTKYHKVSAASATGYTLDAVAPCTS